MPVGRPIALLVLRDGRLAYVAVRMPEQRAAAAIPFLRTPISTRTQ
jgi:serine protease Do